MNLLLEKKIGKNIKEPLLTQKDWKSFLVDKKELEELQDSYLSTFTDDSKQEE